MTVILSTLRNAVVSENNVFDRHASCQTDGDGKRIAVLFAIRPMKKNNRTNALARPCDSTRK